MSVPVALADLDAAVAAQRGDAYLLTSAADGPPHITSAVPVRTGDVFVVGAGRRTRLNVGHEPRVTLVWPPHDPTTYTLLVDGVAEIAGDTARITPVSAILHRSALEPSGACDSPDAG